MNLSSNLKLSHPFLCSLKPLLTNNQITIFSPMDQGAPGNTSVIFCGSCRRKEPTAGNSHSPTEPCYRGPLTRTLLEVMLRGFLTGLLSKPESPKRPAPIWGCYVWPLHQGACSHPHPPTPAFLPHALLATVSLQCREHLSRVLRAFPEALLTCVKAKM